MWKKFFESWFISKSDKKYHLCWTSRKRFLFCRFLLNIIHNTIFNSKFRDSLKYLIIYVGLILGLIYQYTIRIWKLRSKITLTTKIFFEDLGFIYAWFCTIVIRVEFLYSINYVNVNYSVKYSTVACKYLLFPTRSFL